MSSASGRLPAGRKAELVAFVSQAEQVTVAELAERFDVSPDTVRRDLQQLHQEGLVVRTHGRAASVDAVAGGYTTSNLAEAVMMGEMMERATRVAVLADSSKFTEPLFAQIAELDRADYLVTDAEPPAELAEALAHAGVEVLVADPASSPR